MTLPVHYRVSVFETSLDGPACGYQRRGRLTDDPSEVTCSDCLTLCGFDAVPAEQVTSVEADPLGRIAA